MTVRENSHHAPVLKFTNQLTIKEENFKCSAHHFISFLKRNEVWPQQALDNGLYCNDVVNPTYIIPSSYLLNLIIPPLLRLSHQHVPLLVSHSSFL